MSYHGVNKVVQYSNTINVNVSQSPDKVKNVTSFKTVNIKGIFDGDYDKNSSSLLMNSYETINVDNNLTAPDSGYVNLFFASIGVNNSSASEYNQANKNVSARKTINVRYENTNPYSINLPSRLLNNTKTIIVDSDNSNQILTINPAREQLMASFYQNPATVAQDVEFTDNDSWS